MTADRSTIQYRTQDVDGLRIFYREAGDPSASAVLLLHGFPTSSHMFRNLIPLLAPHFHVVAPDLPGFGFSDAPNPTRFRYSFERLAEVMERFTEAVGMNRYAVYVFDYGAPVGFRLALRHPERITAIVSQNGNAYEEGLSTGWNPIQKYWADPSPENRAALKAFPSRKPPSGNTRMAPTQHVWPRSPMPSIQPCWRARAMPRSSWTSFSTMRATSTCIPSSNGTSVLTVRRRWRCGAMPTHSFSRPGPGPFNGTIPMPGWNSSIPDISPSKRTGGRSESGSWPS